MIMSDLRLSMACWNYDRTKALMDGTVKPDGIDLIYLLLPVEETFFRMLRHHEFEIAEMSLSSYVVSLFQEPASVYCHPSFSFKVFPPFLHLHQQEMRDQGTEESDRQAYRHPGISDDGRCLDTRHLSRSLWSTY